MLFNREGVSYKFRHAKNSYFYSRPILLDDEEIEVRGRLIVDDDLFPLLSPGKINFSETL